MGGSDQLEPKRGSVKPCMAGKAPFLFLQPTPQEGPGYLHWVMPTQSSVEFITQFKALSKSQQWWQILVEARGGLKMWGTLSNNVWSALQNTAYSFSWPTDLCRQFESRVVLSLENWLLVFLQWWHEETGAQYTVTLDQEMCNNWVLTGWSLVVIVIIFWSKMAKNTSQIVLRNLILVQIGIFVAFLA